MKNFSDFIAKNNSKNILPNKTIHGTNNCSYDPITDLVEPDPSPISNKINENFLTFGKKNKFVASNIKSQKKNPGVFGPKLGKNKIEQKNIRISKNFDDCNYTKNNLANYSFGKNVLQPYISIQKHSEMCITMKKEIEQPQISRNSKSAILMETPIFSFKSACKSAYKKLIIQKKIKFDEMNSKRLNIAHYVDENFKKKPIIKKQNNGMGRSIVGSRIGFVTDPFFDTVDFDERGYIKFRNMEDESK